MVSVYTAEEFLRRQMRKKKSRRDGRMKKESGGLVYKPEKVKMGQKEFLIWEQDPEKGRICRKIPYDSIVLAYPEVYDEKTGEMIIPEIQDITKEMDGSLIIWDQNHTMFRIDLSGQTERAGRVFIQLARHIPFAFLGSTPWMQIENDQDFREMLRMTTLYKEINR